jgi:hypothetical protein
MCATPTQRAQGRTKNNGNTDHLSVPFSSLLYLETLVPGELLVIVSKLLFKMSEGVMPITAECMAKQDSVGNAFCAFFEQRLAQRCYIAVHIFGGQQIGVWFVGHHYFV